MTLPIFILGTLSEEACHPYDIKKKITHVLGDIFVINDGALYYQFEALLKKGWIEKLDVAQNGNRPEKTNYGITSRGLSALETEIYNEFLNFKDVTSLYSSLFFLHKVDKQKLASIIEEAIQKRKIKIRQIERASLEKLQVSPEVLQSLQFISGHAHQTLLQDVHFLNEICGRIVK